MTIQAVEQLTLDLTTLGFVALGAAAAVQWYRRRGRAQVMLALSLSLLALVSILGRVQAVVGPSPWLGAVSLVAFLGCGYFVLMFRDAFVPLHRSTFRAATALLIVASLLGIAEITVL